MDILSHLVVTALIFYFACSTEKTNSFHCNLFIENQLSLTLSTRNKLEDVCVWVNDVFLIHNDVQSSSITDSSPTIIVCIGWGNYGTKVQKKKKIVSILTALQISL